jgi:uncharacterized protein (TIGR02996 family)
MAKRKSKPGKPKTSADPSAEEAGFITAIEKNPNDATTHLAYADWLDEHDRPIEAAEQRDKGGVSELYYRVRRKSDGLFSEGPEPRYRHPGYRWTTKGKMWRTLSSLRAHLAGCRWAGLYGGNTPWKDIEITVVEIRINTLAVWPVKVEGRHLAIGEPQSETSG